MFTIISSVISRKIGILLSLLLVAAFASQVLAEGAPAVPRRIVSLGPINTENVYLLGAGDRLVADTSYCIRPEDARKKPKIGSVMQISVEKILSLKPDLVLATDLSPKMQVKKLEEMGITVERFSHARSFVQICEHFSRLGQLLGLEDVAEKILDSVNYRVARVQAAVAELPPQRVFLQVGSAPLAGSVASSFTNDFIKISGGINVIADQRENKVSTEKIIAVNPDVIIIAIMGGESGLAAEQREVWMHFESINAVCNNRVHVIDPDLVCSPSPRTFAEALEAIAPLVHPGLDYSEPQK